MNLYQINKIPFKEKKTLVQEACLMYKKIKTSAAMIRERGETLSEATRKKSLDNFKGLSIFETVMGLLNPEEYLIIKNEFLSSTDSLWYLNKWSKTTYYKIKHKAVDQFIYLLYA